MQKIEKRVALIMVDHGSRFNEANDMLLEVVRMVKGLSAVERIYPAHMELAEPSIAQAFAQAVREGATAVVVHPYFLAPGRHSTTDIPRMVEEAAKAFPGVEHCVTAPLCVHPKIGEVVLERVGLSSAAKVGS
jgi:sirohydrochlorin ferrochelatase